MRTDHMLTRLERVFARLDREPERPAHLQTPRMSRHRVVLLGSTLAFYLAIVVAVLTTSWLVRLDWQIMFFRPYEQWPQLHAFLDYLVVLGQRGPTAVMVAAWLGWRSWRQHTLRPLITLGVALLLLNVTVGAVKIGLGRLGPHYATEIGSAELFAGGDIFPSGHTANAVVTWGILAYLASTVVTRRVLSVVSAVVSLSVGATTVYLGTHWVSDVLLGWTAGLLILLALPWFEPLVARAEAYVFELRELLRRRLEEGRVSEPVAAALTPLLSAGGKWQLRRNAEATAPVPAAAPANPQAQAAGQPAANAGTGHGPTPRPAAHLTTRPHVIRSERTPVTPVGSRRPPHTERTTARGAPARPIAGG
ncbi:phosphatase PAP2 family protein [Streptomyces sp. NPDC060334]|uniref:phosphatase PAP2 family protein n=1 Tax=unclassified Streptomyces TaxID=2593676 RepID=UPI0022529064|nr:MULTISPECIES: phosphatase PAP2 family protein [unclassified Streptomyces]MCX5076193.1 phosphatase PAP2 family protein [Streptomyces sp. NBC_00424]MCX5156233.1 phosphatase PAP2 family protein [Streptomyces sp. NBC_00291]WUD40758.1 phosphatase PAP2 family protein [Streptomyces sp. NBC_00513]